MKEGTASSAKYRKDYAAYPWDISRLELHFDVAAGTTMVRAEMEFRLKDAALDSGDLVLNGSDLQTRAIELNGKTLANGDYLIEGERLTITGVPRHSSAKLRGSGRSPGFRTAPTSWPVTA